MVLATLIAVILLGWTASTQAQETSAAAKAEAPVASPALAPRSAAKPKPAPDYAHLADPKVAAELKLSDEQRAKVAALIKERTDAVAKAAPADRTKALDDSDAKLAAVLNDEQRALFAQKANEPKLRFNFRFQRWADVLEWFAEQSDLSLVLDAPPPGTFNYTDAREYTPTEAIDLLNGVLQTKDFTLVRRDRMLLVVDLKNGVPEGAVPRVSLEELDQRGRFELVSVMFPLGNRNAEDVDKEIKPLLGRHGKSVPLPKTKQILVTDMAGVMRAVDAVITSIPEPAAPPQPPKPPEPEKPLLTVYPFKSGDPGASIETLKTLIPGATFVYDAVGLHLNAFATPSQHAAIKPVLEQMQANIPPEQQSRLELYSVDAARGAEAVENLRLVAPKAQIRFDPASANIVAFASPEDHAKLKDATEKLAHGGSADQRQVEVYRLTKAEPATTLALLQTLLPQAKISADAQTKSIVALATPDDQKIIKATLEQLQPENPGPDTPELRVYSQKKQLPTSVTTVLASLAPKAQLTYEAARERVLVVASPSDHKIVEATLARFAEDDTPANQSKLEFYRVTPAERKRLETVLAGMTAELPGIRIVTDAEPGELAIWARPDQHALIADIIEKLKRDVPEDQRFQLVAYTIQNATPQSVLTVLQELYPNTRIVLDAKTGRLLVWTRPTDQEAIRKSIERIDAPGSGDAVERLMLFPVTGSEPSVAYSSVQPLFPDLRLTLDSANKTIIAWGKQAELDKLGKTLEQFQTNRTVSQVYRFQTADPNAGYSVLQSLVPNSRIAVDSRTRSLVVSALPEDHEKIKATIDLMDKPGDASEAAVLKSYPLKSTDAATALGVLGTLFNNVQDVRLSADYKNDVIVAFARPKDHETIQASLDEMQKKESGRMSQVYRFQNADPSAAYTVLSTLVPKAQIAIDSKNRSLVVSAIAGDHEKIKATIEQMDKKDAGGQSPVLRSYPLTTAEPSGVYSMITTLFAASPEVRFSVDYTTKTIVAFATPAQHETIASSIQEIDNSSKERVLAVYHFRSANPNSVSSVLSTQFPRAQIALDYYNSSLVISAMPEDQERIKKTIEEIDGANGRAGGQRTLATYPLKSSDTSSTLSALSTLFAQAPDVRLSADYKSDSIVALATPEHHETIKNAIAELEKKDAGRVSHVYRFKNADPYAASVVFSTLTPKAQLAVDSRNRSLVVSATPADHEKIAATVAQMDAGDSAGQTQILKTYSLKSADGSSTVNMLQNLFATFPEVRISLDTKNDAIVALAPAAQHEKIQQSINDMDKEGSGRTSQVYRLKTGDPQAAYSVLQNLTPRAQLAVDYRSRSLVASATAADHAKIKTTIEQLDAAEGEDRKATLEAYRLKSADPSSLLSMMQSAFAYHPEVRFSVDQKNNMLVALAGPSQHETIRKLVAQVDAETSELEPEFEVFPLEVLEPFAAEMAINRLFGPDGFSTTHEPIVDSDEDSRQLFVRADRKQLEQIRALLVKMGETHLATAKDGNKRRMRVIPFDGDAQQAIDEVRRVWPQLRRNEIRVVTPSAVAPMLRQSSPQVPNDQKKENTPPREDHKPDAKPNGAAQFSVEDKPAAGEPAEAVKPGETPPAAAPSVIIAPGDKSITIASDDPEALDQLESLLRTMSNRQTSGRGRDYIVFSLRNASAERVAATLQQVFRTGAFGGPGAAFSRVVVVPDERLNAIVVHASRNDRETIEELLRILDSADIPESLASNKPKLVPVKNTSAERIEDILRDVYRGQLTAGGGRRPIPVPSGVSPQVAAAIQQANAASGGPLLTLGVDEASNSILVMAPITLSNEIEQLIAELDIASIGDSSRSLRLIPLEKTNSKRVRAALDLLLEDARRGGNRQRRGNR